MDPLSLLRDAIISKKEVQLVDASSSPVASISDATHLLLDSGKAIDLKAPTRFLTALPASKDTSKEFHPFSVVYFAYLKRDSSHGVYFQECQKLGLPYLGITIRPLLVEWLSGQSDSCAYIVEDFVEDVIAAPAAHEQLGAVKRAKTDLDGRSVVCKERVLTSKDTVIIGNTTGKTFENVKKLGLELLIKKKRKSKDRASPQETKQSSQRPMIIVPGALTSLLTLYNVHNFLVKSSFEPTESVRQREPMKPASVTLERTHPRSGKKIIFDVVEGIARPNDWNRVVAVFVGGQAWQFRGWKWEDPVDLFSHVKGFYLKYSDSSVDSIVMGWNVTVLDVNRYKRHSDAQCVHRFWNTLEQWMATRFPQFLPQ